MPRRIYEYSASSGWHAYNLISTIGAFVIALATLVTLVNLVRALKRGPKAGPDPWKGNTLEWFTPSPPPENNFDAIPRVRSVEPMKDIRRQVESQTGAEQRFRPGQADGPHLGSGAMEASQGDAADGHSAARWRRATRARSSPTTSR